MIISQSTIFKDNTADDAFGNWFAGFIDGEGNFQYSGRRGRSFRINLREDDKPILEEIRQTLGCGTLCFLPKSRYNPNQRDQYQISSMYDHIKVLIPLLEKCPLRAKKKNDYIKWRDVILNRWEELCMGKS